MGSRFNASIDKDNLLHYYSLLRWFREGTDKRKHSVWLYDVKIT